MRKYLAALAITATLFAASLASAQLGGLVGQSPSGTIVQTVFDANSDATGFNAMALTPSLAVPSTSTAQAGFTAGVKTSGTVLTTKTTVITTCSSSTGATLPAIQRYEPIIVINRSGGSCLIWPSKGATVETALGTDSAANAPFTMLTNTDVTFRPVSATYWVQ